MYEITTYEKRIFQKEVARISSSHPIIPNLIKALGDADWKIQKIAQKKLAKFGETAVPYLTLALRDEDWVVRRNAAETLSKIKARASVPALIKLLNDPDELVQHESLLVLGNISDHRAAAPVGQFLRRRNIRRELRQFAALTLGQIGDKSSVPVLVRTLKTQDACLRRDVLWGLTGILTRTREENKLAVAAIVKSLRDSDSNTRIEAAKILKKLKPEAAIPDLIRMLGEKGINTGNLARQILERIGKPAIPSLIQCLGDKRAFVRLQAVRSLGKVAPQSIAGLLIPLLTDPVSSVQAETAMALGNMRSRIATDPLITTLRSSGDPGVCASAAEALGKLRAQQSVPALIQTLKNKDEKVKEISAWALGEIAPPLAIPALLETAQDLYIPTRIAAEKALGKIALKYPTGEINKYLVSTLRYESDRDVSIQAARALRRIKEPSLLGDLFQLFDVSEWVRTEIISIIKEFNPNLVIPVVKRIVSSPANRELLQMIVDLLKEIYPESPARGNILADLWENASWENRSFLTQYLKRIDRITKISLEWRIMRHWFRSEKYATAFALLKAIYQDHPATFGMELKIPANAKSKAQSIRLCRYLNRLRQEFGLAHLGESNLGIESDEYYVGRIIPGYALDFAFLLNLLVKKGVIDILDGLSYGPFLQWCYANEAERTFPLACNLWLLTASLSKDPAVSIAFFKNHFRGHWAEAWTYIGPTLDISTGTLTQYPQLNVFWGFPVKLQPTPDGPVKDTLTVDLLPLVNVVVAEASISSENAFFIERAIQKHYGLKLPNPTSLPQGGMEYKEVIKPFTSWIQQFLCRKGVERFRNFSKEFIKDLQRWANFAVASELHARMKIAIENLGEDKVWAPSAWIGQAILNLARLKVLYPDQQGNPVYLPLDRVKDLRRAVASWIIFARTPQERAYIRIIQDYANALPENLKDKSLKDILLGELNRNSIERNLV